ncbi:hypothetical protein GUJ93_ZPchr0003g17534 [Zizania palustris]|uniref:Uncharacterized protein n=1 Tax=Zizania palustris TaxID=103762 RepID=A0A8J5S112_ZIZPA|nr:hypothetical protein GUJ93_ZPchr0003g17534 [Zizania palustris]
MAVARPRVALGRAPRLRARPQATRCARPHAGAQMLHPRLRVALTAPGATAPGATAPCALASTPYAPHVAVPAPAISNHSALSIYSAAVPSPLRAAHRRPYRRVHKRPPRLASVHPHTPRTFLSTLEHSPEPSELALAGNPPEPNSIATVRPQILLILCSIPWDVNPDDNDDHSNINYDDIIVDDEQDGAGVDDDQDEDPEEIEPMTDDEE